MTNTLIIRYNRLGDALISLPIIYTVAQKYDKDTFTVVSNHRFKELFKLMPSNVIFIPMTNKSPTGIFRGISFVVKREILYRKLCNILSNTDRIAILQKESFEQKFIKRRNKLSQKIARLNNTFFLSPERINNRHNDGLLITDL